MIHHVQQLCCVNTYFVLIPYTARKLAHSETREMAHRARACISLAEFPVLMSGNTHTNTHFENNLPAYEGNIPQVIFVAGTSALGLLP